MKKSLVDTKQKILSVVISVAVIGLILYLFFLANMSPTLKYLFIIFAGLIILFNLYLNFFSQIKIIDNTLKFRFLFSYSFPIIQIERYELKLKTKENAKNIIVGINQNDIVVLEIPFLTFKPEEFGKELVEFLNENAISNFW